MIDVKPRWRIIVEQEAARHHITPELLMGDSRRQGYVRARHIAWYRMHRELGYSLSNISRKVKRDPSTILHGVKIVEQRAQVIFG